MMDTGALEDLLDHYFENDALLIEALTHKTWLKEAQDQGQACGLKDQQRLEFLGDAFLGYVVARELFNRFPDATEGELTKRRIALVKGEHISKIGQRLDLHRYLRVGRGEAQRLHLNRRILEDTVEALICAVLEDGVEELAEALVFRLFLKDEQDKAPPIDPISEWNERWQKMHMSTPPVPWYYEMDHNDSEIWHAVVENPDGTSFTGSGHNKNEALRDACRQALALWPSD